jgi:hypothetical protein
MGARGRFRCLPPFGLRGSLYALILRFCVPLGSGVGRLVIHENLNVEPLTLLFFARRWPVLRTLGKRCSCPYHKILHSPGPMR